MYLTYNKALRFPLFVKEPTKLDLPHSSFGTLGRQTKQVSNVAR